MTISIKSSEIVLERVGKLARKSHLYEFHASQGRMTEFSGFDMPLWYSGIIDEHNAVRNSAGLFDVSHMGRFSIIGSESEKFLNLLLPTDVRKVSNSKAFYSAICNDDGGIIDDVVTNRLGESNYLMVVNSSNREKDMDWILKSASNLAVKISDESDKSALIACQGPLSSSLLQKESDINLVSLKRFEIATCRISGFECIVSRTGYTGEDGFEITVLDCPVDDPVKARIIWDNLLLRGKEVGVLPCGLGSRDSLRLEAGMCLYGNDIDETTTPIEAGLDFIVDLEKPERFIGKETMEKQRRASPKKKRVAFSMENTGIPRHGYAIKLSGERIGNVTSGTFSPTVKRGIGMGYVPFELSNLGQTLSIEIRNSDLACRNCKTPFYDTKLYGYKRARIA